MLNITFYIHNCNNFYNLFFRYSKKLNDTLSIIIFVQFVISMLVLCSSVYLLSKMKIVSLQFMSLMLYLSCMLYQIFLYCWYGNEIILQVNVGRCLSLTNKLCIV
jgi:hypothetical protein